MQHYVAFLRGINLGNRRIKMGDLRILFEALKFARVETFIASGNVVFSSKISDSQKLESSIGRHLAQSLGYAVDTFVRTRAKVAATAALRPFGAAHTSDPTNTIHAGFFARALSADQGLGLIECRTDVDEFHVEGREYYWLCKGIKSHESKVWSSPQLKALKLPSSSMRNMTTMRKLAALYPA